MRNNIKRLDFAYSTYILFLKQGFEIRTFTCGSGVFSQCTTSVILLLLMVVPKSQDTAASAYLIFILLIIN